MENTNPAPTFDELTEAARPYKHIDAIVDPIRRGEEARRALVAMIAPEHRLAAEHLAHVIEQAAEGYAERFAEEQWRATVRHFPALERAILAVHDHVRSCPAGDAAGGAPPPA